MSFLHKETPEEWMQLADHEIDAILAQLENVPNLTSIQSQMAELKNALIILKRTKKVSLIDNIHARSQELHKIFLALQEQFGTLSKEEKKMSDMEKMIIQYFLRIQYTANNKQGFFYVDGRIPFMVGRANIPGLTSYTSRALLNIKPTGSQFEVHFVGSTSCIVTSQSFGSTSFEPRKDIATFLNFNEICKVVVQKVESFSFSIQSIADNS